MIANREKLAKKVGHGVIGVRSLGERERAQASRCASAGGTVRRGGLLDLGQEWEERRSATGDRRRPAIFTRQNSDPLLRELGERREAELIRGTARAQALVT